MKLSKDDVLTVNTVVGAILTIVDYTDNSMGRRSTGKGAVKRQGFKKMWIKNGELYSQVESSHGSSEPKQLRRNLLGTVPISSFPCGVPTHLLSGVKIMFGKRVNVTSPHWPKQKFEDVLKYLSDTIMVNHVLLSTYKEDGIDMIWVEGQIININ